MVRVRWIWPVRGESLNDRFRSLRSFNSFDGKNVTALDFRKGELIVKSISSLARSGNSETVVQLPPGEQHLIAAQVGDRVIATGLYEKGRYLLYSLPDQSARYSLSYPDHPVYPGLQEKTKAMLYASNVLRVRPDGGAFVCADMYSGVIDFCRVTASLYYEAGTIGSITLPGSRGIGNPFFTSDLLPGEPFRFSGCCGNRR